jgi:hypothetical protein
MPFTDLVVGPLPALHVEVGQILHEYREIAVMLWPEHHVPMVGHHAVSTNPHRSRSQRLRHGIDEGRIVASRMEERSPSDGSIQHVIGKAADGGTQCS